MGAADPVQAILDRANKPHAKDEPLNGDRMTALAIALLELHDTQPLLPDTVELAYRTLIMAEEEGFEIDRSWRERLYAWEKTQEAKRATTGA